MGCQFQRYIAQFSQFQLISFALLTCSIAFALFLKTFFFFFFFCAFSAHAGSSSGADDPLDFSEIEQIASGIGQSPRDMRFVLASSL